MFCGQCGAEVAERDRFCPACGAATGRGAEPEPIDQRFEANALPGPSAETTAVTPPAETASVSQPDRPAPPNDPAQEASASQTPEELSASEPGESELADQPGQPVPVVAPPLAVPAPELAPATESASAAEPRVTAQPPTAPQAEHATQSAQRSSSPVSAGIPDHWRTGILIGPHPLELWIVIGLFALPGAFLAIIAFDSLFNALDLLSSSSGIFLRLALVVVLLDLIVASVAAALLGIAWMLYLRSRVGRALAYVVAGMTFASVVIAGGSGGIGDADAYRAGGLFFLASLAAIVLLGFAPAVREVFTGAGAPAAGEPTSVVIARVCLAATVWGSTLSGLVLFLLGPEEGRYFAYGLLLLGVAAVLVVLYRRLREPDRQARTIVSGAAALAIVVNLLGPSSDAVPLGVVGPATVLVCLWLAPDARRWFGDEPIAMSREAGGVNH